ncbi:MAG: hypothetical protein ACQXXF_08615, partial [Thermoplasmatota archaeon]
MKKTKNSFYKILFFVLVLTIFVFEARNVKSEDICPEGKYLGGIKLPCRCGNEKISSPYTADASGRVFTVYWCCNGQVKTSTTSGLNNVENSNPCPPQLGCCIKQTECVPNQYKEDCGNNKFDTTHPNCEKIDECTKGCCIIEYLDGTYDYYPKKGSKEYDTGVYKLYCDSLKQSSDVGANKIKEVTFYPEVGEGCYNRWNTMVGPGEQLGYQPCIKDNDHIIRAEATKRLIETLIEIKKSKNNLDYYKKEDSTFS